jgi:SHS2 domain-containing protein
MKRYRLLEHTADIGLVAYGQSLSEAFANAAYGLFSIICDLRGVRESESRQVEVKASDIEGLLFDWLNNLIYVFDAELLLLKRFDIREFSANRLKAVCYGEKSDPSRHRLKMGVKSATYHMLKVDKERNQVRVIFDV